MNAHYPNGFGIKRAALGRHRSVDSLKRLSIVV
jgi:hypothetical protein